MELIFFGIGFGVMMGAGLFFLIVLPALREDRSRQDVPRNRDEEQRDRD
ncbi:MAG: hypothetical protein O2780_21990 [Proteobacteria bacterium]|jgi:hypothetical protein|nr:hypothetical protein [Pseudomonadota bacterium]MDA1301083.1 hypothetical protein [Pseudomonadota bacterium]